MNTPQTSAEIIEIPEVKLALRIVALENAVRDFLCYSPRYCELSDKSKNGTLFDDDEMQELIAIRKMYACLRQEPIVKMTEEKK